MRVTHARAHLFVRDHCPTDFILLVDRAELGVTVGPQRDGVVRLELVHPERGLLRVVHVDFEAILLVELGVLDRECPVLVRLSDDRNKEPFVRRIDGVAAAGLIHLDCDHGVLLERPSRFQGLVHDVVRAVPVHLDVLADNFGRVERARVLRRRSDVSAHKELSALSSRFHRGDDATGFGLPGDVDAASASEREELRDAHALQLFPSRKEQAHLGIEHLGLQSTELLLAFGLVRAHALIDRHGDPGLADALGKGRRGQLRLERQLTKLLRDDLVLRFSNGGLVVLV